MKKIIYIFCLIGFISNLNAQNLVFSFDVDEANSTPAEMRVDIYARSTAADETLIGYTTVFWYDDAETGYVSYDESTAQALGWLTAGNFTVTDATPGSVPAGVPAGLTRRIELQQFDGNFTGFLVTGVAVKVGTLVFDNLNNGSPAVGSDMFISTTGIDAGIQYTDGSFTGRDIFIEGMQTQSLPLELITFSIGKHDATSALLSWTTEMEEDFSHFNVQRSLDGVNWRSVVDVQGKGNSASTNKYEIVDDQIPFVNFAETTVYYKLKMIDLNGNYEYSEVRSITFEGRKDNVSLFPNPTTDFIVIGADAEVKNVTIYDINGKVMLNQTVSGKINISDFNAGMYKVVITTEAGSTTKTVVKIN